MWSDIYVFIFNFLIKHICQHTGPDLVAELTPFDFETEMERSNCVI